ncbi:sensor histidine kinase [Kineosporia sp. A_224]|uniref:sensor histidine kinase n=1 Tax=Kineosporia sp. A_224 TaxID=1962180 RepID=UPI0013041B4F|nr:sensor histidine kinase [Kineosporia sp. A_224]
MAVTLFALAVVMTVATQALSAGLGDSPLVSDPQELGQVGLVLFVLGMGSAGLLVAWHRPWHSAAWLLLGAADIEALCDLGQAYGTRALVLDPSLPGGAWALSLSAPLWIVGVGLVAVTMLLRYPSGRLEGRWAPAVDRAVLVGLFVLWVAYAGSDNSVTDAVPSARPPVRLDPPPWVEATVGVALLVTLLGAFVFAVADATKRTVRAGPPQRQQLALLVTSVVVSVAGLLLPWRVVNLVLTQSIPVAVAVGVLRYRLSGIEVVVRRTLLYGGLTVAVLAVFVAVTSTLTAVAPRSSGAPLVASLAVALVVVPLRDRLQRLVDGFVYGDRGDAWRTLQTIGQAPALDGAALTGAVDALARTLRLPGVELRAAGGGDTLAQTGVPSEPDPARSDAGAAAQATHLAARRRPEATASAPAWDCDLVVEGAVVAVLRVTPRRGERRLPPADQQLLRALAPLLGMLVRNIQLADLLRVEQARAEHSTARERERLRRDLHDGLGPSLTGIGLGLEAVDGADLPERARPVITRLRSETAASLEDVRRIIDDLRPARLDRMDLAAVLSARADQISTTTGTLVRVDLPPDLSCLPDQVESAASRILDEALTNVARHARARTCTVTVTLEPVEAGPRARTGRLELRVRDDGIGYTASRPGGIGVDSMRARATILGGSLDIRRMPAGGTEVTARLPYLAPDQDVADDNAAAADAPALRARL